MRFGAVLAVALLSAGVVLVGYAVATGGAAVYLLLVVPVLTGASAPFLAGTACLVVGLFALPFALRADGPGPGEEGGRPGPGTARGAGGVVLVGPVPLFFGSARALPRWARWAIGLAAAGLFLALVLRVVLVR